MQLSTSNIDGGEEIRGSDEISSIIGNSHFVVPTMEYTYINHLGTIIGMQTGLSVDIVQDGGFDDGIGGASTIWYTANNFSIVDAGAGNYVARKTAGDSGTLNTLNLYS